MTHLHFTPRNQKNQIPKMREGLPDPVYVPDWHSLKERAEIMANYWRHVAEMARLQLAMENLGDWRGAND